ncbi:MAG: diacylglycerol kinase [Opitutales bacterium]|nr:diacylglycerol kinase [Opitutales bacterium]
MDKEPEIKKATGVKRIINAVGYSIEGIAAALRHEAAFRQETILAMVLTPLALWLPFPPVLQLLLIFGLFFVMIVELLNSGLEWVVDYISLERHPMAKRAKDMASAAVFLSIINSIILWTGAIYAYWTPILQQFGQN